MVKIGEQKKANGQLTDAEIERQKELLNKARSISLVVRYKDGTSYDTDALEAWDSELSEVIQNLDKVVNLKKKIDFGAYYTGTYGTFADTFNGSNIEDFVYNSINRFDDYDQFNSSVLGQLVREYQHLHEEMIKCVLAGEQIPQTITDKMKWFESVNISTLENALPRLTELQGEILALQDDVDYYITLGQDEEYYNNKIKSLQKLIELQKEYLSLGGPKETIDSETSLHYSTNELQDKLNRYIQLRDGAHEVAKLTEEFSGVYLRGAPETARVVSDLQEGSLKYEEAVSKINMLLEKQAAKAQAVAEAEAQAAKAAAEAQQQKAAAIQQATEQIQEQVKASSEIPAVETPVVETPKVIEDTSIDLGAQETASAVNMATEAIIAEGEAAVQAAQKKQGFADANRDVAASGKETAQGVKEAADAINDENAAAQKAKEEDQKIQQAYQSILSTINRINSLDKDIESAKGKNTTGAFTDFINNTQAEKQKLIQEVQSTLAEVSSLFGGGVMGTEQAISGARFFSDADTANLNAFLSSARVQSALAQGDVNKLNECLNQLSSAFTTSDKVASQASERMRSYLKEVVDVGKNIFKFNDKGAIIGSNGIDENNKLFQSALDQYNQFASEYHKATTRNGQEADWTAEQAHGVAELSKQFVQLANHLTLVKQKQDAYFSEKIEYSSGQKIDGISTQTKKQNDAINEQQSIYEKLKNSADEFAKSSGASGAIITNFVQSADGISKLDFSVLKQGSSEIRNFSMELGSLNLDKIFLGVNNATSSFDSTFKGAYSQFTKISEVIRGLKESNVDMDGRSIQKLLEVQGKLETELLKGPGAKETLLTQLTKEAQVCSAEVEKLYGKMAQLKQEQYFSGKSEYVSGQGVQQSDSQIQMLQDQQKAYETLRIKADEYARSINASGAMVTNFVQSADGISRLDFSVLSQGTSEVQKFSMELGNLNPDKIFFTDHNAINQFTSGIQSAHKQLESMSNLIRKLNVSDINMDNDSVQRLLSLQQQLESALRSGADENTITKIAGQAKVSAAEVEKLHQQMLKMQQSLAIGESEFLGNVSLDGDIYSQMTQHIAEFAMMQPTATVAVEKFNEKTRTLGFTLTDTDGQVRRLNASVDALTGAMTAQQVGVGKAKSIWSQLGTELGGVGKLLKTATFGHYSVAFQLVRWAKDGIQSIREIDAALTELKKVTDESAESYRRFLQEASVTSSVIGSKVSDFTEATANFARLGYTMRESADMAETAIVYKNVADGLDSVEESTQSIISTMKAFNIASDDTVSIADRFNAVGNNFAITSAGIGDALQRSAAALAESGNTIDEAIALVTAANTVVQNPETVGTAFKTLSMRLRGAKADLESAGEDVDGMCDSVSELQAKLLALTGGKVDIMIDENTFKSTYQILKEMSAVWDDMTDINRASALELMGGKRQANTLATVLKNFDMVDDIVETSQNSYGSALAENEKYLDSIQGRIDVLSNSLETLWMNALNSEVFKFLTDVANVIDKVTDKVGLLNTAISTFLSYRAFKSSQILGGLFVGGGEFGNMAFNQNSIFGKLANKIFKNSQWSTQNGVIGSSGSGLVDTATASQTKQGEAASVAAGQNVVYTNSLNNVSNAAITASGAVNILATAQGNQANIANGANTSNAAAATGEQQVGNNAILAADGVTVLASAQTAQGTAATDTIVDNTAYAASETNIGTASNAASGGVQQLALNTELQGNESVEAAAKNKINAGSATNLGVAATTASIGVQLLNSALTMGISLVAGFAISQLIEGLDTLIATNEELIQQADELKNAYQSESEAIQGNLSTLQNLESEFKKLSSGVDDYGNNISLAADDYERYKEIVETIVGISPSLVEGYDSEGNAIANKNGLLEKSIKLMQQEQRIKAQELVSNEKLQQIAEGNKAEEDEFKKTNPLPYGDAKYSFMQAFRDAADEYERSASEFKYDVKDIYDAFGFDYDWLSYSDDTVGARNFAQDYYEEIVSDLRSGSSVLKDYFTEEQITELLNIAFEYDKNVQVYNAKMKEINSDLYDFLQIVPLSESSYYKLNDQMQGYLTQYINNLENVSTDNLAEKKQEILDFTKFLAENSKVQDAIIKGFKLKLGRDSNDNILNYKDYKLALDEFISEINNSDYNDAQKKSIFDMLGIDVESKEFDSNIVDAVAHAKNLLKNEFDDSVDRLSIDDILITTKITEDPNSLTFEELAQKIQDIKDTTGVNVAPVKTYTSMLEDFEKFNEIQTQTSEIVSSNTEVTQEYKDSLVELGISTEELNECFYESNPLVVKNADALNNLVKDSKKVTAQNIKLAKSQAKLDYYEKYKDLKKLINGQKVSNAATLSQVQSLYQEMNALQKTISKYSMLEHKLLGAANAYEDFAKAQEIDEENDYESKAEELVGYLVDAFHTAKLGSESAQAAIKGLVPESVYADLNKLDDKMSAVYKYFTEDLSKYFYVTFNDDGSLESAEMLIDNVKRFVTDGIGNGVFTGSWEEWDLDPAINSLDELAKKMNVTKEVAYAFLQAMETYDISWIGGDASTLLDKLVPTAEEVKALGDLMQSEFDQTPIDLTARVKVSAEVMKDAGYTNFEGDYATLFTHTFNASEFGLADENGNDYMVNVTPILPDGTVIEGGSEGLLEYINGKIDSGESLENLNVFLGAYKTVEEAEAAAERLHELQEDYYNMLNSYSLENAVYNNTQKLANLQYKIGTGQITIDTVVGADGVTTAGEQLAQLNKEAEENARLAREQAEAWSEANQTYEDAKEVVNNLNKELDTAENGITESGKSVTDVQSELKDAEKTLWSTYAALSRCGEPTEVTLTIAKEQIEQDIKSTLSTIQSLVSEKDYKLLADLDITTLGDPDENGNYTINLETELDDKGVATVQQYLDYLAEEHDINILQGEGAVTTLDVLNEIKEILSKTYDLFIKAEVDDSAVSTWWDEFMSASWSKKVTMVVDRVFGSDATEGDGVVNGTANVSGTAFAGGSWGAPETETSLVGELGPEILVRGNKWTTVGENGAEFTQVKKGDIIFNHKQSEELLKNGHITSRGKAYASGTAYDPGSVHPWTGGMKIYNDYTNITPEIWNDAVSGAADAADEFAESLDWIEIKLEEFDEVIGKLTAELENAVTASEKNDKIDQIIGQNQEKITALGSGASYYQNYANQYLNKIPTEFRDAAQNGAIAITDFEGEASEETLEYIEKYREYAQKAADLLQQQEELKAEIAALAQQKFENVATEYENKISLIDATNTLLKTNLDLQEGQIDASKTAYNDMIANSKKMRDYYAQEVIALEGILEQEVALGRIQVGSEAWYEMKQAIEAAKNKVAEYKVEVEELALAQFNLVADDFENQISLFDDAISLLETSLDLQEGNLDASKTSYDKMISYSKNMLALREQEVEDLQTLLAEQVRLGNIKVGSSEWYEMKNAINAAKNAVEQYKASIEDLILAKFNLVADDFDYQVQQLELANDIIETNLDLKEGNLESSKKSYDLMIGNTQKMLTTYRQEAKKLQAILDKEVAAGNIKEGSEEWREMTAAIAAAKQGARECKIALEDLALEKFNLVSDDFENQISQIETANSQIEAQIGLMENMGYEEVNDAYDDMITNTKTIKGQLEQEKAALIAVRDEQVALGNIKVGSAEWLEMQQQINAVDASLIQCTADLEELANCKIDAIAKEFSNVNSLIENTNESLQAQLDLQEAAGNMQTPDYYVDMMQNTKQIRDNLESQKDAMQSVLDAEVAAGNIEIGDDSWYEQVNAIADVDAQIRQCTSDLESYQNSINSIYWAGFDELISQLDYISNETQGLIDIMSSSDMFIKPEDESGWSESDVGWTNEGLATLGLHAQEMERAEQRANYYAEAIEDLADEYAAGHYSESEYLEKLDELTQGQYDAIMAAQAEKDAIVDLNKSRIDTIKKGIEKEIDAYNELIKTKKEALKAEKDLYDFQKSSAEKAKNIADIERQIAALANDTSMAAAARRKKLEAELAEARAEQEELYYERSVENREKALDEELELVTKQKEEEIAEWDRYMENVEAIVTESLGIVQEKAGEIGETLTDKAEEYNVTISSAVLDPWEAGAAAIDTYTSRFGDGGAVSQTISQLDSMKQKWDEIKSAIASANAEADIYYNPRPEPTPSAPTSNGGGNNGNGNSGNGNNGNNTNGNGNGNNTNNSGNGGNTNNTTNSELNAVKDELKTVKNNLESVTKDLEKTKNLETEKKSSKSTKDELASVKKELADTKKDLNNTKEELKTVKNDLKTAKTNLTNVQNELKTVKNDFSAAKKELDTVKKELAAEKAKNTPTTNTPKTRTDKEYYGVALAIINGNYGWGNGTTREKNLKAKGFDAAKMQKIINQLDKDGYVHSGKWSGKYHGITSLAPYHINKFAKGSLGVGKDQLALIDELGEELQLVPNNSGRLEYIKKGTGIVPADLTERLMDMAMNPQDMLDSNRPAVAPNKNIVNTEVNLDCSVGSLVHIEHCDQSTLPDVEKLVNKAFDKHMKNINNNIKRYTR